MARALAVPPGGPIGGLDSLRASAQSNRLGPSAIGLRTVDGVARGGLPESDFDQQDARGQFQGQLLVNVLCDMLGGGIAEGESGQVVDALSGSETGHHIGQQSLKDVEINYDTVSVEFVCSDDGLDTPFVPVRALRLAGKDEQVGGSEGRLDGDSVCH